MSISNITFLEQIIPNNFFISNNSKIHRCVFTDSIDISLFLRELEIDKTYVITFELILSWNQYEEDSPVITLSKPVLITKNSNPRLLSNFVLKQINLACDNYFLDENIMEMLIDADGPGVLIKYNPINLF